MGMTGKPKAAKTCKCGQSEMRCTAPEWQERRSHLSFATRCTGTNSEHKSVVLKLGAFEHCGTGKRPLTPCDARSVRYLRSIADPRGVTRPREGRWGENPGTGLGMTDDG